MIEKKKILLIDDTETFLYILNHILSGEYSVYITKNGDDGLDAAKEIKPDLILLDVMMPGLSGYDVLKILKEDEGLKGIPVILITGNNTEESMQEGLSLGAVDYIKKPFVKSIVLERVRNILQEEEV